MTITVPKNVVPFRVKTGFVNSQWTNWENKVVELLDVPEAYKKELSRLLIANCYSLGDHLICNFEAFYSVARLLFSLSKKATKEDWPTVSAATQQSPRVIAKALDLELTEWYSEEQFFVFAVDGLSAQFSADLADLGKVAGKFAKKLPAQKGQTELKLQ